MTAAETDPNPTDNSSTAPTTVTPVADVALAKIVSNAAPLVSQTFTFTVTAANNGPSTANGIVVTDAIPGNLGFVSAAPSQGAYSAATGLWSVGTLANGASATLVITVTALTPGAFTNTATKTGETELDPNPVNDAAGVSGGVGIVADLTIAKTHAPATFLRGASGVFSLIVSNIGTGPTTGAATVSDTLPAGVTPTAASGTGWSCAVAAPGISCTRGDALAAGAGWPAISVTVSVAQSAAASVVNTATVSGGGDVTPGNNAATDTVPIGSQADLAIAKTGPPNAIPGNNVVYTLLVTNNGPSDAQGVVANDPTPPNLTFVPAGGLCGAGFPCSLGTLASAASLTITATFAIPPGYTAPSPIVNSASVSASTPDPNPANNSSSASTSVAADLEVVKSIVPAVGPAPDSIAFQIVVTNHGPSAATGVTLTDPLPAGLTFVSVTTTQGSCTGGATVVCSIGTLASGTSATVLVTAVQPLQSGGIPNTATVTANEFDPNTANNSSTAVTFQTSHIPTLSDWGLMALGAALAIAGAMALRRQN